MGCCVSVGHALRACRFQLDRGSNNVPPQRERAKQGRSGRPPPEHSGLTNILTTTAISECPTAPATLRTSTEVTHEQATSPCSEKTKHTSVT